MTNQIINIESSPSEIFACFSKYFLSIISKEFRKKNIDEISSLDYLHEIHFSKIKFLEKGTDQSTFFHKIIYSSFDNEDYLNTNFSKKYAEFALFVLNKLKVKTNNYEEWAIQRFPTIRFHFPNNISVFEFHRDSDYSHPIGETNCFFALNECKDSSALQIENNLGFEDYKPLNLKPGEYAILNTSIFKHGDVINLTGKTRVSMDFRFIPSSLLTKGLNSLTAKKNFSTESYFIKESDLKKIL